MTWIHHQIAALGGFDETLDEQRVAKIATLAKKNATADTLHPHPIDSLSLSNVRISRNPQKNDAFIFLGLE